MTAVSEAASEDARRMTLTRAALAADPQAGTGAARAAQWQGFIDRVRQALPDLTDEADIERRAKLLQRAYMAQLSARAARARERAAKARREEREAKRELAAMHAAGYREGRKSGAA